MERVCEHTVRLGSLRELKEVPEVAIILQSFVEVDRKPKPVMAKAKVKRGRPMAKLGVLTVEEGIKIASQAVRVSFNKAIVEYRLAERFARTEADANERRRQAPKQSKGDPQRAVIESPRLEDFSQLFSQDKEDLLSECLLRFAEVKPKSRPYAFGIARNVVREWIEKRMIERRFNAYSCDEEIEDGEGNTILKGWLIADAVSYENLSLARCCLKKLTPTVRQIANEKLSGQSRHWAVKERERNEKLLTKYTARYVPSELLA